MKNSFIFLWKISWLLLCRLSEVPWPPSDWLQMPCLINFQAKSLAWLNTALFWACPASEGGGESSCLQPHALFGDANFAGSFLGAQDLVPRLYLVFCFWWVGQVSWCLRWDLQRWTAGPRYQSQYFYFHFSLTLFSFLFFDYVADTSFVHAPSRCWAELSWTTACPQGSGFILWFSWYPNCSLLCWLFRDPTAAFHEFGCFSLAGLGKPSALGTWTLQQWVQSNFHALLAGCEYLWWGLGVSPLSSDSFSH